LGIGNLTHRHDLASDFGKIISIFGIGFVSFFKHLYGRFEWFEPPNMPMNRWKPRFAWLSFCAFVFVFPAQAGAADPPDVFFIVDAWSTKEGLPQSSVISMIQTRDGYLWLGTLNGLVRFDGNRFTVFDQNNTPGLNSGRIVYLFEDSHTNLWIGTDTAGVALARDGKVTSMDIGHSGHQGRLVSACEDSTGGVWLYTADARLGRYQNGKLETLPLNFNPLAICRMITAEKSGPLWIGEDWGMFSFRTSNFHPPALPFEQQIRAGKLAFILAGQRGGMWRLINGRVQKWNATQCEKDFGPFPWDNAVVTSACEDRDGNLIVGTLGEGVFWYDAGGTWRRISTEQGLSHSAVLSLCLDREGNLWVGTDGGGLDRIKKRVFIPAGETRPWVAQSISEDTHGGLWAAFNAHGVTCWFTNSAQDFGVGRGSNAWTVLVDRKQDIWVGTRGEGLFQFHADHFQPAAGAENLDRQIYTLFEDHQGRLWAGTQSGLARWNGTEWSIYTTPDGLVVRAIAEDAEGNLWVGTEGSGLYYFKAGKLYSYQKEESGLAGNDISCLYVDKEGTLWIGTAGHGLARFFNGKWTHYSTSNGLVSNSISYIIEDDESYLWIGSNAGLMRLQKKLLNDFAGGTVRSISCRTYDEADGLPTRECSAGSQPAACRALNGRLWFPTTKGLVSVNPAELQPNRQPPLVMIESVLVEGREQKTNRLGSAWNQSILVPPGYERLEIHYTGLNFTAPNGVRFKYRLEGHETAWTDAGDTRVAYYSNLAPGHYYFHVTASNEDGMSNETGSELEITVQPQFWQTGWFLAAVIVCFLSLVVAVVRYLSTQKLHRQLQALKQQEALEKERSRIARDLHDQLGANLTQVALLGEMAETDKNSPAEIESHAQQISHTARETTRSLDEIVWAVNPSNDTVEGLVNYACKYAQEYLALAGLRYRADVPAQLPAIPIPPEVRHNVFLAFKEAINNVVKHAQASEVWIRLRLQSGNFVLSIEDNGRGLGAPDARVTQTRNGLRNMRKRMEDIGGQFEAGTTSERGTLIRLTVPVKTK
jgi:ligand-binding sensor domain-containing protein/signal transduction histidine kinase